MGCSGRNRPAMAAHQDFRSRVRWHQTMDCQLPCVDSRGGHLDCHAAAIRAPAMCCFHFGGPARPERRELFQGRPPEASPHRRLLPWQWHCVQLPATMRRDLLSFDRQGFAQRGLAMASRWFFALGVFGLASAEKPTSGGGFHTANRNQGRKRVCGPQSASYGTTRTANQGNRQAKKKKKKLSCHRPA